MRYAKRKRNLLPAIKTTPSHLQQLLQQEHSLTAELEQLDHILNSDGLTLQAGYIFTHQLKNRLADDVVECASKQHRLVSYGLELWGSGLEAQPVRVELVHTKPTFKEKLLEISMRSVEKYELEKQRQLERLQESRWKVTSTSQSRVKTLKLKTELPHQHTAINHTATFKDSHSPIYNYATAKKIVTEAPVASKVGVEEVERMLKKQATVVSIWLPPKTYPQFYGILVPSLARTTSGATRCRIKKYMLFKEGLSRRFFTAILDYLSSVFQTEVDSMEMIMAKGSYLAEFKNCGWVMKSWEGVDKINAVFSRQE